MAMKRLENILVGHMEGMAAAGSLKGDENEIAGVVAPVDGRGRRYLLAGHGDRHFLRLNSNSYLGLSLHPVVLAAEEEGVRSFGAGPGAVRFISGTWSPHVALERRLAAFHDREAAILFSSAYSGVMGLLPPLITDRTAVISDELNHNSIINAISLARPAEKRIYPHLDLATLERHLVEAAQRCTRAIIVTDGIFSMRGDHAPLREIRDCIDAYDDRFSENAILVVDDSHGVGAFGATGRGTEEVCDAQADIVVATLGKALGVNGGYVVGSAALVRYLRETSPFYIYSNSITPAEAAAAHAGIDILDSAEGQALLKHLKSMTVRFRNGLASRGFETLPGEHPVVPLMIRDTARTASLTRGLRAAGIFATGLAYPVVPKGQEEIRFQLSAEHTIDDIDEVLAALSRLI